MFFPHFSNSKKWLFKLCHKLCYKKFVVVSVRSDFKLCHKLCYKKLVFALRLGGWAQFPAKSYKGPKKYDPINGSLLIKGVTIDILSYKGIMGKLFLRERNITPTWINMQSILFIVTGSGKMTSASYCLQYTWNNEKPQSFLSCIYICDPIINLFQATWI